MVTSSQFHDKIILLLKALLKSKTEGEMR